jgi:CheY-like chemotaxis protein
MSADGHQRHILAINDSDDVLNLFRELLSEEGYRVSVSAYAAHDLKEVHELRPDLIILDYMWSSDDAGWSMLQMLKMDPMTTGIPIILCTGAVRQVRDLDARLTEMDVRVVLKPFDITELLDTIGAALNGTSPQVGSSPGQDDAPSG